MQPTGEPGSYQAHLHFNVDQRQLLLFQKQYNRALEQLQRHTERTTNAMARSFERMYTNMHRNTTNAMVRMAQSMAGGGGGGSSRGAGPRGMGGGRQSGDIVQGQLMPERTRASAQGLLKLSSAAQGTMMAMAALDGSVMGLMFGLVFLSYGITKVVVAAALLTATLVGLQRIVFAISRAALSAGIAFEESGQKMANWLRSAEEAMAIKQEAGALARAFGLPREELEQMIFTLRKAGLEGDIYNSAIMNAASAGAGSLAEISTQFTAILKADADKREELIEKFAKSMDIEVRKYESSLDLATAINDRFAGSTANMAKTSSGMIGKMRESWKEFIIGVGIVMNNFLKPIIETVTALFDGLTQGFASAREGAEATGELQKVTLDFTQVMRRLMPYMYQLGFVLGKVLFKALILAAQGIKVLATTMVAIWNRAKPIIDVLRNVIKVIKEILGWIIGFYKANNELINTLALVYLGMFALNTIMGLFMGTVNGLIGLVRALAAALLALPKRTIDLFIKTPMKALDDFINKLNSIGSKNVPVNVVGLDGAAAKAGGLADNLKKAADEAKRLADNLGKAVKDISTKLSTALTLPTGPHSLDDSFKNMLLKSIPGIIQGLVTGLAVALAGVASAPVILVALGVLAAAIAVGLAAAFPRETGVIVNAIANGIIIGLAAIPILIATQTVAIAAAFTVLFVGAAKIAGDALGGVLGPIVQANLVTFQKAFGNFVGIFSNLLQGDFVGAFKSAYNLTYELTLGWLFRMTSAIYEGLNHLVTETVPATLGLLADVIGIALDPLLGIFQNVFGGIFNWMVNWGKEFYKGAVEPGFKMAINGITGLLDKTLIPTWNKTFGKWMDQTGISSTTRKAFESLREGLSKMPNPFAHIDTSWLNPLTSKLDSAISKLKSLLPGGSNDPNQAGSSSGGGGASSGSTDQALANMSAAQAANRALDQLAAANGGWGPTNRLYELVGQQPKQDGMYYRYKIYNRNNANTPQEISFSAARAAELGLLVNGEPKRIKTFATPGIVPGARGSRQLVLAEGGERFMGHPTFDRARGKSTGVGNAVPNVIMHFHLEGALVDSAAMRELASKVASELNRVIGLNRPITLHGSSR